ncbi:MAG: hypothetical protein HUJ95_01590, partial [Bacteroidales bacterium]|nr:hypothetical protein [Bacteroidales bacterium]
KDKGNFLSYDPDRSVYDGEGFPVLFPDKYSTWDDPTQRDFLTDIKHAKSEMERLAALGDTSSEEYKRNLALYSDLSKLVISNAYGYTYKEDYISPYFSANFSVTKEIGNIASISFYANNFFISNTQLYSTKTGTYVSSSSYVPSFFYGLTLRLKIK